MTTHQAFRKRRTFNTSYYSKQKVDENTRHYQIKRWIGQILKEYCFKVFYEYTDPYHLLAPKQIENNEPPDPYKLDILAYNEFRGEIITCEVNGPYHYKKKQIAKDRLREAIIRNWVKIFFIKTVEKESLAKWKFKPKQWIHKHVAVSRDDIYKGFLDYNELVFKYLRL